VAAVGIAFAAAAAAAAAVDYYYYYLTVDVFAAFEIVVTRTISPLDLVSPEVKVKYFWNRLFVSCCYWTVYKRSSIITMTKHNPA
jgi:hypothetical protein